MLENPTAITKRGTFANQGLNYLNNCSIIGPKRSLPVGKRFWAHDTNSFD